MGKSSIDLEEVDSFVGVKAGVPDVLVCKHCEAEFWAKTKLRNVRLHI